MLKSLRINLILGIGGALVGIFTVFSKEPVAGAVIAGLLSIVTTVGFFFLQKEKVDAPTRQIAEATSTGVLWFYGALLVSALGFLALAYWVLPTELDTRRDVMERFLKSSNIQSVLVDRQTLAIPDEARQAAAALILKSDDLVQTSNWIQPLSTGGATVLPAGGSVDAGVDFCKRLGELSGRSDSEAYRDLAAATSYLEPQTAAELLQLIAADRLPLGVDLVRERYCPSDETP